MTDSVGGTPERGLHGHPFDANIARLALAELVGTCLLVMTIVGAVVAAVLAERIAGAPYGSLAVPLAGGAGLATGIAALGHISGAHFNPAVTIGLAVNRRFPWRWVPAYVCAQIAGSALASTAIWAIYGARAKSVAKLAAPSPGSGVRIGQAFTAEAIGGFLLVLVVVAVATDERAVRSVSSLTIGLALLVGILVTGPVSGAGLNPARSLGPMVVASSYRSWWLYLIAPIVGGCLAVAVYDRVLRAGHQQG